MAFRFGQRRVADPLAQQNFEQLEGIDLEARLAAAEARAAELEKVARRRGGAETVSANFAAPTVTEFSVLPAGGDSMYFSFAPALNCWWEVEYRFIVRCLDAAWVRIDPYVSLDIGTQTTDAAGVGRGPSAAHFSHGTFDYNAVNPRATFKLEAGKSYTARPLMLPQNGTWNYWMGVTYTEATAKVVGFW